MFKYGEELPSLFWHIAVSRLQPSELTGYTRYVLELVYHYDRDREHSTCSICRRRHVQYRSAESPFALWQTKRLTYGRSFKLAFGLHRNSVRNEIHTLAGGVGGFGVGLRYVSTRHLADR